MTSDTKAASAAVDKKDHFPISDQDFGHGEGQNVLKQVMEGKGFAESDRNNWATSSTRPASRTSTQPEGSITFGGQRSSYELPGDRLIAVPGTRPASLSSIQKSILTHRESFLQSSDGPVDTMRDASINPVPRASTFIKAEETKVESGDAELGKFLLGHFSKDIFEISKPKDAFKGLSRLIRSFDFDLPWIGKQNKEDTRVELRLSLAGLNRMRLRKLQIKLTHRIMRMHYYEEEPDDWESLLEQYVTATRDNDYIRSCIFRGLDDPFLVRSERHVDAAVLNAALLDIPENKLEGELWTETVDEKMKFNFVSPVEKEPRAIGGTRMATTRKQKTQLFFKNVVFATVGGAFLVGPMWLMVLVKTQYASLISTSVFVFAAGLLAAWKIDDPIAVLSTTAAYAAVLVVFVGTSTAPTTS